MLKRPTLIACTALAIVALAWTLVPAQSGGKPRVSSGDVNGDGGVDIGDAVYLLDHLFQSGPAPVDLPCPPTGVSGVEEAQTVLRDQAFADLQSFADTVGMTLDPDEITVLSTERGLYVDVLVADLDTFESPGDYVDGQNVSVSYFGFPIQIGTVVLPPGVYVHAIEVDLALYSTGVADFTQGYLIDASGAQWALETSTVHFPGSSPVSALGVRATICDDTTVLEKKTYISCPQLGDLLSMTCSRDLIVAAPTL